MTSKTNPILSKSTGTITELSREEEEKLMEEARELFLWDQRYSLYAAMREGYKEGMEERINEVKQEILQESRKKGIENGIQISKHKIAEKLITMGLDDDFISQATGLPPEEIQKRRIG